MRLLARKRNIEKGKGLKTRREENGNSVLESKESL
jgi:hypothetical protein